jgi:hypothetical protein
LPKSRWVNNNANRYMGRVKVVFAVVAMLVVMVTTAAPAMARHNNDGLWDNCDWVLFPWWGWFVVCEVDDGWRDNGRNHYDDRHQNGWWW